MSKKTVITLDVNAVVNGEKSVVKLSTDFKQLREAVSMAQSQISKGVDMASIAFGADQLAQCIKAFQACVDGLCSAYKTQIEAETKLETVMRERMDATDADIAAIKELAAAQQALGVIGDEVQLAGAQQIATFVTQRSTLETLIPAMNNLIAQQKGLNATISDAVSVANLMGKAMQGNASALTRVGITLSDTQKNLIKYGDETTRAATLVEAITQNVGQMNEELANTDAGKQKQLENTLGDIKEQIGGFMQGVQPMLTFVATTMMAVSGLIKLGASARSAYLAITGLNLVTKATAMAQTLFGNVMKGMRTIMLNYQVACVNGTRANYMLALSFKAVLISSGVGIAILAVCEAINALCNSADDATDAVGDLGAGLGSLQDVQAEYHQKVSQYYGQELKDVDKLYMAAIDETKSREERIKSVLELQRMYPAYFSNLDAEKLDVDALGKAYQQLAKDILKAAEARAAFDQIVDNKKRIYEIDSELALLRDEAAKAWGDYVQSSKEAGIRENEYVDWATSILSTSGLSMAVNGKFGMSGLQGDKARADKRHAEELSQKTRDLLREKEMREAQNAELAEIADSNAVVNITAPTRSGGGGKGRASTAQDKPKQTEATPLHYIKSLGQLDTELNFLRDQRKAASLEDVALWDAQVAAVESYRKNLEALIDAGIELPTITIEEDGKGPQKVFDVDEINRLGEMLDRLDEVDLSKIPELDVAPKAAEELATIAELEDAINYYREKQKEASGDEIVDIQRTIEAYQKKLNAINNTLSLVGKAQQAQTEYESIDASTMGYQELSMKIKELIRLKEKLAAAGYSDEAKSIESLISLYDEMRKKAARSFDTVTNGWEAFKGLKSGIEQTFDAFNEGATILDRFIAGIDGVLAVIQAITAITSIIKMLTATSTAASAAQIAANKEETESYAALATAKMWSTYAGMPFVGPGLAAGFTGMMLGSIELANNLPMLAEGGLAFGPTTAMIGEYPGASTNPEVIAPLNKLQALLQPRDSFGMVEFVIKGETLRGVLRRRENHLARV